MPLQYKIDIISALKDKGFSTYKIQKEKLFSQSTLQKFRNNQGIDWKNIEQICRLLECQPSDFMEYIEERVAGQPEAAE